MTSIDQRVVEMQFDNAAFERGIDQTLRSLRQLDSALNVDQEVSGFDKLRGVIDNLNVASVTDKLGGFKKALDGIKAVAGNAFSSVLDGVGNVIKGIGLIKGVLGAGVAGVAISGGWTRGSNINMAEFKLKSLLKDEEMVRIAMENASAAVTDTAYSLDSAAIAAANLTASGVQAGQELEDTLKTISGLAAVSGRDYDSVSNIMSAIASQGKLTGMQVKQFALSGLNVLAPLAEAFGTTEAEISDMVSKSKISFEMFRDVMRDNFADQAFKANETFTGVLANLRSALARSTADLFQYGQNAVIPVIENIRQIVNTINKVFKPLMGMTENGPGLLIKMFQDSTKGAAQALSDWNKLSVGPERFANLVERIIKTLNVPLRDLKNAAYDLTYIALDISGIFREAFRIVMEYFKPIQNAFNATFGKKNITKGAKDLKQGLDNVLDVMNNFSIPQEHFNGIYRAVRIFFQTIKTTIKTAGTFLGTAKGVLESFFGAVSSMGGFIIKIGGEIGKALSAVFEPITKFVGENLFGPIRRIFDSLTGGFTILFDALRGDTPIKNALDFIRGIGSAMQEGITGGGNEMIGFFDRISEFFSSGIYSAIDQVKESFSSLFSGWDVIAPFFDNIASGLGGIFDAVSQKLNLPPVEDFFSGLTSPLGAVIGIIQGDEGAMDRLLEFGKGVSEFFGPAFEAAGGVISDFGQHLMDLSESFKQGIPEQAQRFLDFIDSIGQAIGPVVLGALDTFVKGWTFLVDTISNAGFSFDPFIEFFNSLVEAFLKLTEGNVDPESIGKFAGEVLESVKKLGSDLSEPLGNVFKTVGDEIYGHLEGPMKDLADWVLNITTPLDNLSKGVSDTFGKIGKAFDDTFGYFTGQKNVDNINVNTILDNVDVEGAEEKVDSMFSFFVAFDNLKKFLGSPVSKISDWVSRACWDFATVVNEFVNNLDLKVIDQAVEKIATLGVFAGSIFSLYEFGQMAKSLTHFFDEIGKLAFKFGECVREFKGVLKAQKMVLQSTVIVNMALSLGIIVAAIIALAWAASKYDLTQAIIIVGGIGALIAIMLAVVNSSVKGLNARDIKMLDNLGDFVFKFGLSIAAIAALVYVLGRMDPKELEQGRNAMLALIGIVTIMEIVLFILSALPGDKKLDNVGNTMLKLAGTIVILTLVAQYLGIISKMQGFQEGLGLLVAFGFGITMFLFVMAAIGKHIGAADKAIVSIAILLVALVAAVKLLEGFSWQENWQGLSAVLVLLAAATASIVVISKTVKSVDLAGTSLALISAAVAIGLLAASVAGLSIIAKSSGWENMLAAGAAIFLLAAGMAFVVSQLAKLNGADLTKATVAFIACAVAIDILVLGLAALTLLISEQGLNVAAALGAIVVIVVLFTASIVAVTWAMDKFKPGALLFVALIAAIGLAFIGFGSAVSSITGFLEFLRKHAPDTFKKVGEAIGNFAESLGKQKDKISEGVNGALTGVSDGLKRSAKPLGNDFFDTITEMVNVVKDRGGELIVTVGSAVVNILTQVGSYVSEHKDEILEFIQTLLAGAMGAVLGFGSWLLEKAGNWISELSGVGAGQELQQGWFESDADFEARKANMAVGQQKINKQHAMQQSANTAVAVSGDSLADEESYLPAAKQRAAEEATEIVQSGSDAAKQEAEAQDMGSVFSELIGGGLNLSAPNVKAMAGALGVEIPPEIMNGIQAGVLNMDNIGNFMMDNGTFDMSACGEYLNQQGISNVEQYDEGVDKAAENVKLAEYIAGDKKIDEKQIRENFAHAAKEGVQGFIDELKKLDFDISPQVTKSLQVFTRDQSFRREAQRYGTSITTAFKNGLSQFSSKASDAATSARTKMKTSLSSMSSDVSTVAKNVVSEFGKGMDGLSTKASSACSSAVNTIKNAFSDAGSIGFDAGANYGQGLANGIDDKLDEIAAAAERAAAAAKKSVTFYLQEKSPSRVAFRIGQYFSMGLAIGILDAADSIENASTSVSETIVDTFDATMDYVDALSSDIESNPVIRPVLDLSDYNAGLAAMDGLNTAPTMANAGYVARLATSPYAMMEQQTGGGTTTNTISITLNYDASADANQIVTDIANGLASKLALEGA